MNKGLINRHSKELDILMRFLDLVGLIVSGFLALYWSFENLAVSREQATIGLLVVLVWVVAANVHTNLYRPWRGVSLWVEVGNVTWVLFLVLVTVGVVIHDILDIAEFVPKMLFIKWLATGWCLLVVYRITLRYFLRWMRRKGYNRRHIVVAGAGDLGKRIVRELAHSTWTGLDVVAFFDDRYHKKTFSNVEGIPVEGTLDNLHAFVEKNAIEQVWIALPLRAELRVKTLLRTLRHSTIDVLFIPDIFVFDLLNHSFTQISGIPIINLSVSPMVGMNRIIKAMEDRVLAFFILLVCIPVMILIAVAVKKSSPGPVLFRQMRHGWDGKQVEIWKFRTMHVHKEPQGQVVQAQKSDTRITSVGAFLRRTSLDELPQFIHVLQGRMSIVGPRPHAIEHNVLYMNEIDLYMKRHIVKPGITGWAQVNGLRGETDVIEKMEKRLEYDLYYIENWSLMFDIRIIFMTICKTWTDKNAY